MLIEDFGHIVIAVTFALHDMAPVTGEITNRDKHQFVIFFGLRQNLSRPRLPSHGVFAVHG